MERSFRRPRPALDSRQIRPNLPVVCSNGIRLGIVERVERADFIRLAQDEKGQHHYIPLSWVTKIDDEVHVDRSREQAIREWTTTPKRS